MIKIKTYKIITLSLAFQILVSNLGLTLDVHFCQGEMKRFNLFGIAKSCLEVSQKTKTCHNTNSLHATCGIDGEHQGCCNNKSFDFDFDIEAVEAFANQLMKKQTQFVEAFVQSYFVDSGPSSAQHNYIHYYPQPLKRNISVLFQTFLL